MAKTTAKTTAAKAPAKAATPAPVAAAAKPVDEIKKHVDTPDEDIIAEAKKTALPSKSATIEPIAETGTPSSGISPSASFENGGSETTVNNQSGVGFDRNTLSHAALIFGINPNDLVKMSDDDLSAYVDEKRPFYSESRKRAEDLGIRIAEYETQDDLNDLISAEEHYLYVKRNAIELGLDPAKAEGMDIVGLTDFMLVKRDQDKSDEEKRMDDESALHSKRLNLHGSGYIIARRGGSETIFSAKSWAMLSSGKDGWKQVVKEPAEVSELRNKK